MRILDQQGAELATFDQAKGALRQERLLLAHHEAVAAQAEEFHYEVEATYPNGGQDLKKVVDTPEILAQEAWDEYEDILRFVPYTAEELEALAQPTAQDDADAMLVDHELRLTLLELAGET